MGDSSPRNMYPLWDVHWQAGKRRWKDTGRPCTAQSPPSTPSQPALQQEVQHSQKMSRSTQIVKGVVKSLNISPIGYINTYTRVWRKDQNSSQHWERQDPPLLDVGTTWLDFKQSIFPSSAIKRRSHRGVQEQDGLAWHQPVCHAGKS